MDLRNVTSDIQNLSRPRDETMADLPLFAFGGRTYVADLDAKRLGAQLTRVIAAMSDGRWRTLSEIQAHIQRTTGKRDPEASLSARLRDIRKVWGEEAMESRRRVEDGVDGLWEYRSNAVLGAGQ